MEKKLLIQDIAEAISTKGGVNKKTSETFVKALFETIEQGLTEDKFVKIKGLGTFKVIAVGERESVNINTGERFSISGHDKITFTPDTSLKDLVNRPFSHFQTVILNDETNIEELENIDDINEELPGPEKENADSILDHESLQDIPPSIENANACSSEEEIGTSETMQGSTKTKNEEDSSVIQKESSIDNLDKTDKNVSSIDLREEENSTVTEQTECENIFCSEKGTGSLENDDDVTVENEENPDSNEISSEKPQIPNEPEVVVIESESPKGGDFPIPKDSKENDSEDDLNRNLTGNGDTTIYSDECDENAQDEETIVCLGSSNDIDEPKDSVNEMRNSHERKKKHNIWKRIAFTIFAIAILLLTYFAGYFKVFCPCELWNRSIPEENLPLVPPISEDSLVIEIDSTTNNTDITKRDSINFEHKKDSVLYTTLITTEKAQGNSIIAPQKPSVTNKDKEPETIKVYYKQVEGGKYEITGTLRTHKIERGETIRTIAQEVYGSKGYATYIITYNELANPNLIDTGTVIKLPKLKKRK